MPEPYNNHNTPAAPGKAEGTREQVTKSWSPDNDVGATGDESPTASTRRSCAAQRVSRCAVCLPQRGQNLLSSRRSGVLRRFFFVM